MGATAIGMPSLGMTMEEGTVLEWPLAVGDPVALLPYGDPGSIGCGPCASRT